MTGKELSYIEDAIGHESNIIKICENILSSLTDENLIAFMDSEIKSHANLKKELLKELEVKCNE